MGWLGWMTLAIFIIGVLLCLPIVFARSGEDAMGAGIFVVPGVVLIVIAILIVLVVGMVRLF